MYRFIIHVYIYAKIWKFVFQHLSTTCSTPLEE